MAKTESGSGPGNNPASKSAKAPQAPKLTLVNAPGLDTRQLELFVAWLMDCGDQIGAASRAAIKLQNDKALADLEKASFALRKARALLRRGMKQ